MPASALEEKHIIQKYQQIDISFKLREPFKYSFLHIGLPPKIGKKYTRLITVQNSIKNINSSRAVSIQRPSLYLSAKASPAGEGWMRGK